MKTLKTFASAAMAGLCIGLGGLVYLAVDNRIAGSALFTLGLFVICSFGLDLFTGKVCYLPEKDGAYALMLPVIWLGNFAGTGLAALAGRATRIAALAEKAAALCAVKLDDGLLSLFVLGMLCNMLIYLAVEGYRSIPYELGKYLALFFGVMIFILIGTEHCVADMFYFSMAGLWSGRAALCILTITLGNAAGGLLLRALHRFALSLKKAA